MTQAYSSFRAPYVKASKLGIPKDRYETDYIEFEDGDYRLGDLKGMGWNLEIYRHGHTNELYLFYEASNQPKESEGGGLKFLALENISGSTTRDTREENDDIDLKVFAYGYGYEDGIRHIYYGSGHQKGYSYYPSLTLMAEVLKRVEELSQYYSRSADTFEPLCIHGDSFLNH